VRMVPTLPDPLSVPPDDLPPPLPLPPLLLPGDGPPEREVVVGIRRSVIALKDISATITLLHRCYKRKEKEMNKNSRNDGGVIGVLRRGAVLDELENDAVGGLVELGHREERDDVHDDVDTFLAGLDQLLLCDSPG